MPKISKVLVLGCSGLVGHGISVHLLSEKFLIVGTTNKKNIKSTNKKLHIYNNIDLTKKKSFSKIIKIVKKHKIHAIIHSSALIPNKKRYNQKNYINDSIKINAFSFFELINICEKNNIKFLINISTPNVEKMSFDDLKKHHNFYIYTKYLAEKILLNHHNPKVKLVSLRIKSPYGYILNTKAVIPSFINSVIKKKKLILTGDINKRQVFTFTEDIGSACLNIFKKKLHGVANCVGKDLISIKNLSKNIEKIFKTKNSFNIKKIKLKELKIKNNLNKLNTPINLGLQKILNANQKFLIYK